MLSKYKHDRGQFETHSAFGKLIQQIKFGISFKDTFLCFNN